MDQQVGLIGESVFLNGQSTAEIGSVGGQDRQPQPDLMATVASRIVLIAWQA
jgi:hypothetical protein